MPDLAPEAKAREHIDAHLTAAGWTLQDYTRYDGSAARAIALREIPVKGGRCDYMLLLDRNPVGVIEAKKAGTKLSAVAEQSAFYGANAPDFLKQPLGVLPFCYESTGVETFFRDERDPDPRSRQIFSFHRPETLADWLSKWYETIARDEHGHAYRAMSKAGGHRKYLERYWPDKLPMIERLINLMRKWDTDTCEILSTTYAAWNDLIIWGREVTDDAILDEVLNRWHPQKRRFKLDRWRKAIRWMTAEGFVPIGFGRPTAEQS